jgi:hypothetical protein
MSSAGGDHVRERPRGIPIALMRPDWMYEDPLATNKAQRSDHEEAPFIATRLSPFTGSSVEAKTLTVPYR